MRSTLSILLLAAIAAFPAGAQDISIVASSCAADDFLAAAGAPGNPCEATDYVCQCTTGKQFTQDYLTKALTADPGTCTSQDIAGLAELGERFCATVPGVSESTSSNSTSSSSASASGTATASSSSSSSSSSLEASSTASNAAAASTGAGTRQAVGGVVGLVGAAALFVL